MVLFELLQKVVEVFERLQIPYLVTGAIASVAYGEPRLTNDIDIVAAMRAEHISGLLEALPSHDFYVSEEAMTDAIQHQGQFNIIHPSSGLKVDVIMREDSDFDRSRFSRIRRIQPAESYEANFASPEDVVIKKMEYYKEGGSEKHLRDITGILKVTGNAVDRNYISDWARRLNLVEIWDAIQDRLRERP
jgi:hypothetical protein